jgi:hypothetical protein
VNTVEIVPDKLSKELRFCLSAISVAYSGRSDMAATSRFFGCKICADHAELRISLLLDSIGLGFVGNKYDVAPRPAEWIVDNPNYAIGLINSDGHCRHQKRNGRTYGPQISFVNTVQSIIVSFSDCLRRNGVEFSSWTGRRQNERWKTPYGVLIARKSAIRRLKEICKFETKRFV